MSKKNITAWDCSRKPTPGKSSMEGNEMNVFSQSHYEVGESSFGGECSGTGKNSFRHFVEESSMRNISLDELEELSEAGCTISGIDGNIGRTPSTVSSEQAPIRFAVLVECNKSYLNKPEAILRLSLLACSTISLSCITNAGTIDTDILNFPFSLSVRAHIFVTVFSILLTITFFLLGLTTVIECFPSYWNVIDAALHGSLSMLFIFSSTLLFRVEHDSWQSVNTPISEWTEVLLSLSAVFGFLCALECVFLVLVRIIRTRASSAPENIVMSSLVSS